MNYNTLRNKPTINHKELIGNNKASDIGGMTEEDMQELLETDLTPYYSKAEIDDLFSRSFVYREKSGSIVTFDCPSTSQSIPELTVGIEATQSGSGDPSPTNVRPISGHTEANVTRCGKNLFDAQDIVTKSNHTTYTYIEDGYLHYNAGNATVNGINWYGLNFPCPLTFSGSVKNFASANENVNFYATFDDGTQSLITIAHQLTPNEEKSFSVIIGVSGKKLVSLINSWSSSRQLGLNLATTQLELGSTATEYEPYNGHTYTTALKDENDQPLTCYGGQLENVNGVQTLTVTHANIASYNGETINEPWISSMDVYSEGATPTTGAQVVYPLTTPTEIPQDNLAISTQDGTNNLWADTGDIEVKCLDRIIPAEE